MDVLTAKHLQVLKRKLQKHIEKDPDQSIPDDYSLLRYLRAFYNAEDAFEAIVNTHQWRKEYQVHKLDELDYCEPYTQMARVLCHRDIDGRPIIYIPVRNHNATARDINVLTKYMVLCLEEACGKCHDDIIDSLCIVFDMADFKATCMDMPLIKNIIWLLTQHYPERLGICLILNAPYIFSGFWILIRQLLDKRTCNKVIFVNGDEAISEYLPPEILPVDM